MGLWQLKAVKKIKKDDKLNPIEAWEQATLKIFGESVSKDKGCSKCSFLALCELGIVECISKDNYTKSIKNKKYVQRAIKYIYDNKYITIDKSKLWEYATENVNIKHNCQMDVVLALYGNNLLMIN